MAMVRSVALVLAVAMLANAEVEKKRSPVAPMDIIYGTTEAIYDIYAAAYGFVEGHAHKHGVHTKVTELHATAMTHVTKHLGEDPMETACKKAGLKKTDITDKLSLAQEKLLQGKAQAYEHGSKVTDLLNEHAGKIVTKFETHVPSYTGVVPKTFMDVLLVSIYVLCVFYVLLRIMRFMVSLFFSIFCCLFCCGACRRRKTAAAATGKKGKAAADAKAAPKPVAKKAGKK